MRAIKQTMALITDSIGCTKCAPAQMPWHLRHLNPALLNRQGMCTYPKMENGSELCHWKRQLIIGLRANPVRPRKPPQIGAKLGTLRGGTTRRNVKAPPYRHVSGQHGLAKSKVTNIANTATRKYNKVQYQMNKLLALRPPTVWYLPSMCNTWLKKFGSFGLEAPSRVPEFGASYASSRSHSRDLSQQATWATNDSKANSNHIGSPLVVCTDADEFSDVLQRHCILR